MSNLWKMSVVSLIFVWTLGCSQGVGTVESGGANWISLFDGRSLEGWRPLDANNNVWTAASAVKVDPADNTRFVVEPGEGILVNGPVGKTSNIVSLFEHGDCEAHIEWCVPKGSNSGVYFQGLYEIQVFDSFGKDVVTFSDAGGIYARWINDQNVEGHAPRVNASRAPGEWQTFDAIFRAPRFNEKGEKIENARFVRVVFNGQVVHQDVTLNGPTRASLPNAEAPLGPIMLQGDHGPVAYRNIRIRPLNN